ncbi:MAG: radical SAM protein [Clostridia bacterium]|nr:radical SAM protein [Clostridia bacterium]
MPKCGSQCYLCDLPIRFDTYEGCSHACEYCFVKRKNTISNIKDGEGPEALLKFINGQRNAETSWCDWNIPLHWGGMSDPFQPVEKHKRRSLECLKIFKETQYPFVVSTKGKLIAEPEYLELIKDCNCVVQISLVCDSYDKLEPGCPSFAERLEIAKTVAAVAKRLIIRIQPYMCEVFEDVFNNLEKFKDAGAYGVIVEGMKFLNKRQGTVKIGGDFLYPYERIKTDILALKERAHELGLKFYSGENRTRELGDSLTCCGIDGLDGFVGNHFNLNHIINGERPVPTEKQKEVGTAICFRGLHQRTIMELQLQQQSFARAQLWEYQHNRTYIEKVFGKMKK